MSHRGSRAYAYTMELFKEDRTVEFIAVAQFADLVHRVTGKRREES